jgi:hypothetical protein
MEVIPQPRISEFDLLGSSRTPPAQLVQVPAGLTIE